MFFGAVDNELGELVVSVHQAPSGLFSKSEVEFHGLLMPILFALTVSRAQVFPYRNF